MKKIKLFDYQEDMVKRVQEAFKHHDAVMVQMPTGTGKTMVLANIVFSFLEKSNNPIWIVAHRRELVSQIKETIFSKITPSLFTLKEGSTAFPKPLSPQGTGDVTAPPVALNRCALRLAGHQSPRQVSYAGWDRRGTAKNISFFNYSDRYLTIQGFNSGISTSIVSQRLSGSIV